MPNFRWAHAMGRAALGGVLTLCAAGALAADDAQMVVSPNGDARSVEVRVSDLNLADAYSQRTLELRIDRAAHQVCNVHDGSRLNKLPGAVSCLTQARAGALAQLAANGVPAAQQLAAAGGMR